MEHPEWKELYESAMRLNARLEKRLADRGEFWLLVGQVITGLLAQTTDAIQADMHFRASLQDRLLGLVPAITNTIFKREVFPLAVEDSAIVEAIFNQSTDDEIKMIAHTFGTRSPELGALIVSRWERHQERTGRKSTQAEDAVNVATGNNGEDDAAGTRPN